MIAFLIRRNIWVLLALIAVAILAAGYAGTQLKPTVATDQFVSQTSSVYKANQRVQQTFGEDAVTILVKGKLTDTMLSSDLGRLVGLEGCLSGNAPKKAQIPGGANGPCGKLTQQKSVVAVYGPGTFINEAVRQIGTGFQERQRKAKRDAKAAAEAARKLAQAQGKDLAEQGKLAKAASDLVNAKFLRDVLVLSQKYGLTTIPSINDPRFVADLIFNSKAKFGTPKARFAYLFPNQNAALIQVRLKSGLSERQRSAALAEIERAVGMSNWKLNKGSYVVTGVPLALERLSGQLTDSLLVLMLVAIVVMAAVLLLAFRQRPRLLPLALALTATAFLAALVAILGLSVTVASIAALPIMLGLAIDYALQFQARIDEEVTNRGEATERAAAISLPTVALAAVATLASFLAILISPVPLLRGFAASLIAGIALAVAVGFCGSVAGFSFFRSRRSQRSLLPVSLLAAGRGAASILRDCASAVVKVVVRRPAAFLSLAVVLSAVGWVIETRSDIETDIFALLPSDQPAVNAAEQLKGTTGLGGTVQILISGDSLTNPATVKWIQNFRAKALKRYGGGDGICGRQQLCVGLSYADLLPNRSKLTQTQIERTIDDVPRYYTDGVINRDRDAALLSFGIKAMPVSQQEDVIAWLRENLKPPRGVSTTVTGLPVILADANSSLTDPFWRIGTLLLALLGVLLVLFVALRKRSQTLTPLLPIVLASGWAALILWLLGVKLNPLSASIGALVIAISTEFSIILSQRYWKEREGGLDARAALTATYQNTGRAVLASVLTAVAGFAVLISSDIPLLRDFGASTVVGLTVSLLGVALVLPATFILLDRGKKKS